MAIIKKPSPDQIIPGKWACKDTILNDGVCAPPRLITRTSAARVYFIGKEGAEKNYGLNNVAFLCDSEEEGLELVRLEKKLLKEVSDLRKMYQDKILALCVPK